MRCIENNEIAEEDQLITRNIEAIMKLKSSRKPWVNNRDHAKDTRKNFLKILKLKTEIQLQEVQSGFRKDRGVQDNIFTLKQLIEKNIDKATIKCSFYKHK